MLLTAGADSSIRVWDISEYIYSGSPNPDLYCASNLPSVSKLKESENEVVRCLGLSLNLDKVFVGMSSGKVMGVNILLDNENSQEWKTLFEFDQRGPCISLEIACCNGRDVICVGHCKGSGLVIPLPLDYFLEQEAEGNPSR